MRCLSCAYDLKDLPAPRCPECGRDFDPDDPSSVQLPRSGRTLLFEAIAAGAMVAAPLLVGWLLDIFDVSVTGLAAVWLVAGPAMIIIGFGIAYHVFVVCVRARRDDHPWILHRRSYVAAWIVSGVILLGCLLAFVIPLVVEILN